MTMTMNENEIIFPFFFPLKHLYIHIYMTNNGNMEKSRSHGLIYLTFPILTSINYDSIKSIYTVYYI